MRLNHLTPLSPAVPMAVAITTTPTRLFVAATALCPWTSMCQVRPASLPHHTRHRLLPAELAGLGVLDVSCVLQGRDDGPCLVLCPPLPRSAGRASFHLPPRMALNLAELQGLLEVSRLSYLCIHWPLPPVGFSASLSADCWTAGAS